MDVSIDLMTSLASIEALKDEWNRLLEESVYPTIYMRFEYIAAGIRAFADPNDIFVIVMRSRNDNKLIAIFPFKYTLKKHFVFSQNSLEYALVEETDKPYPIIKQGCEEPAWKSIAKFLKSDRVKWDALELIEMRQDAKANLLLAQIFRPPFFSSKTTALRESPLIALDKDWETLWGRHKHMRKKYRLMTRDFGDALKFEVFDSPETYISCLNSYIDLESRSWKAGKVGISKTKERERFYHELFKELSTLGIIRFGFLYVGDLLVSGEIAYAENRHIYFCHGSYDEKYSKYSPGLVSKSLFIKHFHEKGYTQGDYLAGYADYMKNWAFGSVKSHNVKIYRWSLRRVLYIAASLAGKLTQKLDRPTKPGVTSSVTVPK